MLLPTLGAKLTRAVVIIAKVKALVGQVGRGMQKKKSVSEHQCPDKNAMAK